MSYSKACKAISEYTPKNLGYGSYIKNNCRCTVGAISDAQPGKDGSVLTRPAWLTQSTERELIAENDIAGSDEKPEDRYVRMLAWLKNRAIEEKR